MSNNSTRNLGHSRLCEYCSRVNLSPDSLETIALTLSNRADDETHWNLGSGQRILNTNCTLCRFISSVFPIIYQSGSREDHLLLSELPDVNLEWFPTAGPGRRGAFKILVREHEVCFCIANTGPRPAHLVDSKYMYPVIESQFNVERLSAWIAGCEALSNGHTTCRVRTQPFQKSFPGLSVLRLIDVERQTLVELQTVPRYVALSYVWGEAPSVRLTSMNKSLLMAPEGIEEAWQVIPRTIRDAIKLVYDAGARYLWVDALCLIQNDPDDLARGINVMDQIYARSWFTIVAACGHDADAGLPGVTAGSRPRRRTSTRITDETSLGLYVPLHRALGRSVYISRAWTFQEQLLARRVLYFVDNQVFFRCRNASRDDFSETLEDHAPEQHFFPYGRESAVAELLEATAMKSMWDYKTLLQSYTPRSLTDQNDVLRAMTGILRQLSENLKCSFFEGLPVCAMDTVLLFQANGCLLRRRKGFPSYSWTGWKGGITMDRHVDLPHMLKAYFVSNFWLERSTWIIWNGRQPGGWPKLLWDPPTTGPFPSHDTSLVAYRARFPFRKPPGSLRGLNTERLLPTRVLSFEMPQLGYPVLQFWTLSVHFKLRIKNVFRGHAAIVAAHGGTVGVIVLDGIGESAFFDSQDAYEFILLSHAGKRGEDRLPGHYNVMLLEWAGGVAERRGLGAIKQVAIEDGFLPGPQWKEIFLA